MREFRQRKFDAARATDIICLFSDASAMQNVSGLLNILDWVEIPKTALFRHWFVHSSRLFKSDSAHRSCDSNKTLFFKFILNFVASAWMKNEKWSLSLFVQKCSIHITHIAKVVWKQRNILLNGEQTFATRSSMLFAICIMMFAGRNETETKKNQKHKIPKNETSEKVNCLAKGLLHAVKLWSWMKWADNKANAIKTKAERGREPFFSFSKTHHDATA